MKLLFLLLVICVEWMSICCFVFNIESKMLSRMVYNVNYHLAATYPLQRKGTVTMNANSIDSTSSSKGFGTPKKTSPPMDIKPSGAAQFKHKSGDFAKLLIRESKKFDNIIKLDLDKIVHDCYARLEGSEVCWFIGKIAHIPEVSMRDAFQLYTLLLKEYAKSLRPKELAVKSSGGGVLQIWHAPGNSEMGVAQNKISLKLYDPTDSSDAADVTKVGDMESFVGFQPEVYQDGEEGFRVRRDSAGLPLGQPFEVNMDAPKS